MRRYNSRLLTRISGWLHRADHQCVQLRGQQNWTTIDILGVNRRVNIKIAAKWYDVLGLRVFKSWPISNPFFRISKPFETQLENNSWIWDPLWDHTNSDWRLENSHSAITAGSQTTSYSSARLRGVHEGRNPWMWSTIPPATIEYMY